MSFPTPEEVHQKLTEARNTIADLRFHDEFTIEDYPIGGRDRGQCKISTETKKNNGVRTVRQTTNKHGRWCNPKKSTYRASVLKVVSGDPLGDKDAAWLDINTKSIGLQFANGDWEILARAPHHTRPNRTERKYKVQFGGEVKENTIPADDPALCDAYDVWVNGINEIVRFVKELASADTEAIAS